jgi:hypothetical protein
MLETIGTLTFFLLTGGMAIAVIASTYIAAEYYSRDVTRRYLQDKERLAAARNWVGLVSDPWLDAQGRGDWTIEIRMRGTQENATDPDGHVFTPLQVKELIALLSKAVFEGEQSRIEYEEDEPEDEEEENT